MTNRSLCQSLNEYIDEHGDFSFELKTVSALTDAGIECEHGGLYEDPVTKKSREFDIRAVIDSSPFRVFLPIECKNLRENYPLLVMSTPRREREAYHEILVRRDLKHNDPYGLSVNAFEAHAIEIRIQGKFSRYGELLPVGKSLAQVGRTSNGALTSNDEQVFDRCSQALASAADLVADAYSHLESAENTATAIVPVLVVPDNRLWQAEFDAVGGVSSHPRQVEHATFYLGKHYSTNNLAGPGYTVSHLEIMTLSGLTTFAMNLQGEIQGESSIFSKEGFEAALKRMQNDD